MSTHCAYPPCGKELVHVEGRRKKKYCDSVCKLRHWQMLNPVKKPSKFKKVPLTEWEDIQKRLNSKDDASKQTFEDVVNFGVAVVETKSDGTVESVPPMSNKAEILLQISEYEKEIATLGVGQFASQRKKFLQKRIAELKDKINKFK